MSCCCFRSTNRSETPTNIADIHDNVADIHDNNENGKLDADFLTVRAELLKEGKYFVDPNFPPNSSSLYPDGRIPEKLRPIDWKRAKEIYRKPLFVLDGVQRHDLDQGSVGNCWFVAAAANLAIGDKSRFERVVPLDQDFGQNYAGIFHFNFWWYGRWKEVIVDDYLPTRGGNLIYCHNKEYPNEFWPALLEKAYAKLRGSYQALDGGHAQDAMVDLTGGISEVINISNKANIPADLYYLMHGSDSMESMQVAAVLPTTNRREFVRPNGLVEGHAYSITKFQQLRTSQGTIQLVRLRNPWGRKEWNGAWSDHSEEMTSLPDHVKDEMDIKKDNEGEFWMSFTDLARNVDLIELCHLRVDSFIEELRDNKSKWRWNVSEHHSAWTRNDTAGGSSNNSQTFWKNPQFYMELTEPDTVNNQEGKCTLIASLMQQRGGNEEFHIGFIIYQLKQPDHRPLDAHSFSWNTSQARKDSGPFVNYREITRRFELSPGYYVIIPCTYYPNQEAKFVLRLFTEKPATSRALGERNAETPVSIRHVENFTSSN